MVLNDSGWRAGSLTLEAACVLPVLSLFLIAILLSLYGRLAQFCWLDATHKTSQELRLGVQMVSRGVEAIAGDQPLLQEFRSLPQNIQAMGADLGTSAVTGGWVLGRIQKAYDDKAGFDPVLRGILKNPRVFLHWEAKNNLLWIVTECETPMVWGNWRSRSRVPVPLWLDWPEEGEDSSDSEDVAHADNFWSWGNWKRGKYLREELGANLPDRYPVLSYYSNGVGRATKSMDLTAPTWKHSERLQQRIDSWAQELLRFDGTEHPYGNSGIHIQPGMIRERQLHLVIPENRPEEALRILEVCAQKWRTQGITIDWEERETSHRYDPPKDSPPPP